MKKVILFLSAAAVLLTGAHALTFSGTAATSVSASAGNSSFVIVDTNDDGLAFNANSVGSTFTSGQFLGDSDDYVVAYNSVVSTFGTTLPGNANFTLGNNGITGGDDFYIVFFNTLSGDGVTTSVGNTFGVLNGSNWEVSNNNGDTLAFGASADFQQFGAVSADQTIVPEPSAYATIAGLLALGWVATRRRS